MSLPAAMAGVRGWAAVLAAAALGAGCDRLLGIEEAVPGDFASYVEDGTGGIARGPGFALRFAGGDGFHFPDALLLDGVDVMGRDAAQGCFEADGTGLLISPTSRISASGGAPPATSRLVPALQGPAAVQVKVEWAARLACNASRAPGGTSTFTVFPDGRIVRHDRFADASTASISTASCACDPAGDGGLFDISTFWTLTRRPFRDLYTATMPDQRQDLPDVGGVMTNEATACVDAGIQQVAFGWGAAAATTATVLRGGRELISFGRELLFAVPSLESFAFEDSSAMFVERRGCEVALRRAREHATPSRLRIDEAVTVPSSIDGIYGGDLGAGTPGVVVEKERFELFGPVASSFAVWLRFPRAVSGVRATREGAEGPWYVPQRVDDRSWIVWFRDPLEISQSIAIELQ